MPPWPKIFGGAILALWTIFISAPAALAHYHVFWPKTPGCYGKPGQTAVWTHFWGHPFEMRLDDPPAVPKFAIRLPGGKKEPVLVKEIRLTDQESGRECGAFEAAFTPGVAGDYYLTLESPPAFIPEENLFCQDFVKGVFHVMAEKGWDERLGLEMEIIPLTRPYGWPAGTTFTAKALFKGNALKLAPVEVEKFSGFFVEPGQRPKDRFGYENAPLITRTAKTDANGYFAVTLDSPGWWLITVSRQDGKITREGEAYPLHKRGCLLLHVEEPLPPIPAPGQP